MSDTSAPGEARSLPDRSVDQIVTAEVRAWIGRGTEGTPIPEALAAGDIRRYVEATGDRNPLWLDDDRARAAGYRGRAIPPMMLIGLSWRLGDNGRLQHQIPLPAEYTNVRNASLEVEWFGPAHVGDVVAISHRLVDIVGRSGRRGIGVYITRATDYCRQADGELLARVQQTTVRLPETAFSGQWASLRPERRPDAAPKPAASPMAAAAIFGCVAVGESLPMGEFGPLTIDDTVKWAGSLELWEPLHFDREYARGRSGQSTFIASGAYRQALLARWLTDWLGAHGRLRKLYVRHTSPTLEGDRMCFAGRIAEKAATPGESWIVCELEGTNERGDAILVGRCFLDLSRS